MSTKDCARSTESSVFKFRTSISTPIADTPPIGRSYIFIVIPLQFEHNRSAAKGCARYRNRHRVSDTGILISLIVGASLSSTSVPRLDCGSRPKGEQIPLISGRDIKVCRDNAVSFVSRFSFSLSSRSDVRREEMETAKNYKTQPRRR